jgi:Tfp pilus assembly protein PilV
MLNMLCKSRRRGGHRQRGRRAFETSIAGFSLVEVTLAIGVVSFCLLTLLALIPAGLMSVQSSTQESNAVNIGVGIFSDLKASVEYCAANPATMQNGGIVSSRYGITVPTAQAGEQYALYLDDSGNQTTSSRATFIAILTLTPQTITGQTTLSPVPKPAVLGHLLIGWPAGATPSLPFSQAYSPASPSTDMRLKIKNLSGYLELPYALDLEQ